MNCFNSLVIIRLGIVAFLAIHFHQPLAAQEQRLFDLFLWNKKIGRITASKQNLGDTATVYLLESNTRAKILWIDKTVYTYNRVEFRNGKIHYAEYKEIEDGKVKRWSKTHHRGGRYEVESSSGKKVLNQIPVHCIATLHLDGENKSGTLFYEGGPEAVKVKQRSDGGIEFKGSDGNLNIYYFKNGLIDRAEFHTSIAKVELKPVVN